MKIVAIGKAGLFLSIALVLLALLAVIGLSHHHQSSPKDTPAKAGNYSASENSSNVTKPSPEHAALQDTPPPTTPTTSGIKTNSWKTYKSNIGDFSLEYPSDWSLKAEAATAYSPYTVTLAPLSSQHTTVNSYWLTLWVNDNPNTSYQPGALPRGSIQSEKNGLNIWTTNEENSVRTVSTSSETCPVIEIVNKSRTHFSYQLSNGSYLTAEGGYCQLQNDSTTYSYQQQLSNEDWQTAIAILSRIQF